MHLNGIRKMTRWTMIKRRHNIFVIGLSALVACSFWVVPLMKKSETVFSYKIFKTADGWGYDILVNDELFIHQELIPAIQGQTGFQTKMQAEQAARLIINKMERGQLPTVTTFELEPILSLNKTQHDQPGTAK